MTTADVLRNKLGQLLQHPPMEPSGWTGSHAATLTPCSPAPHHEAQVAGRCHGHPSGCLPLRLAQGPELAEGRLAMTNRRIQDRPRYEAPVGTPSLLPLLPCVLLPIRDEQFGPRHVHHGKHLHGQHDPQFGSGDAAAQWYRDPFRGEW